MPPPPPTPIVEVGAVSYNANRYAFFGLLEGERKSFLQARMQCREECMRLVTVRDGDEHKESLCTLVEDYFEANHDWDSLKFWVGYRVDNGGNFMAIDGTNASYVEARLTNEDPPSGGCVFGDKMRSVIVDGEATLDFHAFTVSGDGECEQERPFMCEESACSICDTCVERMYDQFNSQVDALDLRNVSAILDGIGDFHGWKEICDKQYSSRICEEVSIQIARSERNQFNFARRPAAICAALGECDAEDECDIISPKTMDDAPKSMNFCTEDGTVGGTVLGDETFTDALTGNGSDGDECIRDEECTGGTGLFCNTDGDDDATGSIYVCDNTTGIDASSPKGICASLCEQPAVRDAKEQAKELFPPEVVCTPGEDDCADGFECLGGDTVPAVAACRTNFNCDKSAGFANVTFESCPGMCFRVAKEMDSAEFSTDGNMVRVNLTTRAHTFDGPCSDVFDEETTDLLGLASCYVSSEERSVLVIDLRVDANVFPGGSLTLNSNEDNPLVDYFQGGRYNGSVTVEVSVPPTDELVPPVAIISGPSTFRQPCADEPFSTLYVDSSASGAASGRPLSNRTWGLDLETCNSQPGDNLLELIRNANSANDGAGLTTLKLENDTLATMDLGVHCITLNVTNFLGKDSDTPGRLEITKQETDNATPTIEISAPSSTSIGLGVTLSASVVTSSVCKDQTAEYQWRCISEDCNSLLDGPQYQSSVTLELSASDLIGANIPPGSELEFELSSRFKIDGNSAPVATAKQSIQFNGDSIEAGFTEDSPSGDISRNRTDGLRFQATGFDPSDPNNVAEAMRFSFKCEQPDGISLCFKSSSEDGGFYTGEVEDGNKWLLDVDQFVDDADEFILSVAVKKGSGDNLREDTASRFIRLRPVEDVIVNARLDQDCKDGRCPSASPSTKPLSFAATILNCEDLEGEPTYRWMMNGKPVLQNHLLDSEDADEDAEVNAASITVSGNEDSDDSILPRSGGLTVECKITSKTAGPANATGTARTSISLVAPPVCTSNSGCLELDP